MRGSLRQRSPGSWQLRWTEQDPITGHWMTKATTVKGTKKHAEGKLAEILHDLETGSHVDPSRTTVREFLQRWLLEHVDTVIDKPKSRVYYHTIVEGHLIPALGAIPLAKLSPLRIQQYCREAKAQGRLDRTGKATGLPLSSTTIQGHHRTLHLALESAVKWQLLARNPCDATTPPPRQKIEMTTWGPSECMRFLEAARPTRFYALFATAIYTGLRMGELLGLRWRDVDLEASTLTVQQTLERSGIAPRFGTPKTARSRRTAPLPTDLVAIIKTWKAQQNTERLALGSLYRDYGLVFTIAGGAPINGDNLRKREFSRLITHTGLPLIRFHDLRHSFASLLLGANMDLKMVSELMGHANIAMTADIYGHLRLGPKRDAVDVLGRVLRAAETA